MSPVPAQTSGQSTDSSLSPEAADLPEPSILLVSQQVRGVRSGVGTYVRLLLEELKESPFQLAVATWDDELDPDSYPWLDWVPLGSSPRFDPTPGAFYTLGRRVAERAELERHQAVHFLDAREAWRIARRGAPAGVRLLGTVHDDYAIHAPRNPLRHIRRAGDPLRRWAYYGWLRRLERRTYAALDLLMTNANATGLSISEGYDIPLERIVTVPLTVGPIREIPPPVALAGQPALLFAGGNFYRKGLDVLVRAISLLRSRLPGIRLHIAGRDPLQRKIERLARRLGVAEHVVFHGRVSPSQMEGFLLSTDLFVMPSRREALGLVYLEAFRAKVPVIAGSRGGVAELIEDGRNGLLVPPEQPARLAEAVLRITRDPALRRRLVSGGLETFEHRSPARLAAVTAEIYARVLSSSASAVDASTPDEELN
jgi:glycosyltransferase involved in cell wall biosynthesis